MTAPLDDDSLATALKPLADWRKQVDGDARSIARDFKFGSFKEAMSFMVRVGFEAEAMGHHPTLTNVYNRVTIALNTHDAGNRVTEKDIALAKKIDAIDWTR